MKRATYTVLVAAAMLGVLGIGSPAAALAHLVGKPAPKITNGTWIHSKPLSLADLRGKVVLLEFWTYG